MSASPGTDTTPPAPDPRGAEPGSLRGWVAGAVLVLGLAVSAGAALFDSVARFRQPVHPGHELAARLRAIAEAVPKTVEFRGRPAPVVVRFVTYPEAFQPFAEAIQDENTERRASDGALVLMLAQQLLAPRLLTIRDLTGIPHHVLGYFERSEDVPKWPAEAGLVPVYTDERGMAVWRSDR